MVKADGQTSHLHDFSSVWIFWCLLKSCLTELAYGHNSHLKDFSPWILLCIYDKFDDVEAAKRHWSHLNGFCPLWILPCSVKSAFKTKGFGHFLHLNDFSPEWCCRCLFMASESKHAYGHISHLKGFSPVCVWSYALSNISFLEKQPSKYHTKRTFYQCWKWNLLHICHISKSFLVELTLNFFRVNFQYFRAEGDFCQS